MTAFTSKLSQMNFSSVICKPALTGLPSPAVWQLPLPCIRSACTWIQSISPRLTGSQPSCWLLLLGCLQLCSACLITTRGSEDRVDPWPRPKWAIWMAFISHDTSPRHLPQPFLSTCGCTHCYWSDKKRSQGSTPSSDGAMHVIISHDAVLTLGRRDHSQPAARPD